MIDSNDLESIVEAMERFRQDHAFGKLTLDYQQLIDIDMHALSLHEALFALDILKAQLDLMREELDWRHKLEKLLVLSRFFSIPITCFILNEFQVAKLFSNLAIVSSIYTMMMLPQAMHALDRRAFWELDDMSRLEELIDEVALSNHCPFS